MKDDSPFALGGVWGHWRSPDRKQDGYQRGDLTSSASLKSSLSATLSNSAIPSCSSHSESSFSHALQPVPGYG